MSTQVIAIADLREMPQSQIMKLNKDVLVASIRVSNGDCGTMNQALERKLNEISKELHDKNADGISWKQNKQKNDTNGGADW